MRNFAKRIGKIKIKLKKSSYLRSPGMVATSLTLSEHSQPPLTSSPVSLVTVTKEILASKTTLNSFVRSLTTFSKIYLQICSVFVTYLECMSISGATKQISAALACARGILLN